MSNLEKAIREAIAKCNAAEAAISDIRDEEAYERQGVVIDIAKENLAALIERLPKPPRSFSEVVTRAEVCRHHSVKTPDGELSGLFGEYPFEFNVAHLIEAVRQLGAITSSARTAEADPAEDAPEPARLADTVSAEPSDIVRIAADLARVLKFYDRMDRAQTEAERQDEASGTPALAESGRLLKVFLDNAREEAFARQGILEEHLARLEPETLTDALTFAAAANGAYGLCESAANPREEDLARLGKLLGGLIRCLDRHVERTPTTDALIDHYANPARRTWAATMAEAERWADRIESTAAAPDAVDGTEVRHG